MKKRHGITGLKPNGRKKMKQDKNQEKQKYRGEQGFNLYYGELFSGGWEGLREALLKDTVHASLTYPDSETYFMDPASICAALCLPLDGSEEVLDMCAAPGGKTLVLCANLPENARLKSNERSADRKMRLSKVVGQSLPADISSRITVTGSDGATMCRKENASYGSILLDAPCSSERHVLKDPKYLSQWSPSRLKTMSMEQWALLSSAWRMLMAGGYLLYATCALSPKENDENVERLLKKFPDARLMDPDFISGTFNRNLEGLRSRNIRLEIQSGKDGAGIEEIFLSARKTDFGLHILPDSSGGYGPLFFSLVKKEASEPED